MVIIIYKRIKEVNIEGIYIIKNISDIIHNISGNKTHDTHAHYDISFHDGTKAEILIKNKKILRASINIYIYQHHILTLR